MTRGNNSARWCYRIREEQSWCPEASHFEKEARRADGGGHGGPLHRALSGAGPPNCWPPATRMANHEGVGLWGGSSSQHHKHSDRSSGVTVAFLPLCHFARRPDSTSASDNPQRKTQQGLRLGSQDIVLLTWGYVAPTLDQDSRHLRQTGSIRTDPKKCTFTLASAVRDTMLPSRHVPAPCSCCRTSSCLPIPPWLPEPRALPLFTATRTNKTSRNTYYASIRHPPQRAIL